MYVCDFEYAYEIHTKMDPSSRKREGRHSNPVNSFIVAVVHIRRFRVEFPSLLVGDGTVMLETRKNLQVWRAKGVWIVFSCDVT